MLGFLKQKAGRRILWLFLFLSTLFVSSLPFVTEARRVKESSQPQLSDYAPFVEEDYFSNIEKLAQTLRDKKMLEINTTLKGGGVAELLDSLIRLFKQLRLDNQRAIFEVESDPKAAEIVKKVFNAFQGKPGTTISSDELDYLDSVAARYISAFKGDFSNYDIVVVHDAAIVLVPILKTVLEQQGKNVPKFIWRCHYDSSEPSTAVGEFVKRYRDTADHIVYSMPDYVLKDEKDVKTPYTIINPAIDPLSDKNKDTPPDRVKQIIEKYGVDPEKPILLQVSRFDYFKDPMGVIEVYKEDKIQLRTYSWF